MWSLLINNHSTNEHDILRASQIHLEKLLSTKSHINNKGPKVPFFMKNKIYLKQFIKANERKINFGNNIMYNKLFWAANCISPYSKYKNIPKYCAAFDKKKFTYSKIERERTISAENQTFYCALFLPHGRIVILKTIAFDENGKDEKCRTIAQSN